MLNQVVTLFALSGTGITAIVIVGFIFILILWIMSMYNRLVRQRQSCKESWADIDTELQRRHDLIPSLVETVKGYAGHEKSVLDEVTNLRNQAVAANDKGPTTRASVEDQLGRATGGLFATAEAYPDLKANQNFLQLQKELAETETRIARSRRFYNANVRNFRDSAQMFPSSVVAGMGGFHSSEYDFFQVGSESERAPVEVDFGNSAPPAGNP